MPSGEVNSLRHFIALGAIGLFVIVTFALSAATLGTLNRRLNTIENKLEPVASVTTSSSQSTTTSTNTTTGSQPSVTTTTTQSSLNSILAGSIRIEQLMIHLNALQSIANNSGNTRAIGTPGFEKTLDYIENYLNNTSGLNVFRETFTVKNFTVQGNPLLTLIGNGTDRLITYSTNLARSEFTYVNNSAAVSSTRFNLTVVTGVGCNTSDWQNVAGRAALVKAGGPCTYAEKGELAKNNSASALLFYNNGETTTSLAPVIVRLRQANVLPALFLSYAAGQELLDEANTNDVSVLLDIQLGPSSPFTVDNICADTVDGNMNETIVVGSHSDSVPAGPGINDNGSGTAANLVMAANLARLYQSGNYTKYKYRVRFCWWAAEEIGLVGSIYHVQQAQNSSATPGNRLADYLINLNYDMLGSPNYFFGIYNGQTAKTGTSETAKNASIRISETYQNWFNNQSLPWDNTTFDGRSDYGPFLAAGIAAGGLFSGADDTKTSEQRSRYEAKLGAGRGGLAGAILDPCYHRACDTVDNIDQFAYEKMAQAAAYMLEYLGQQNNLTGWLYPNGRSQVRLADDYFPNSDYFRETNV